MAPLRSRMSWKLASIYLMSWLLLLPWQPPANAQQACDSSPIDDATIQSPGEVGADADNYDYPGIITLNMTWPADFTNTEPTAFSKLFDNIYPMMFRLFSCKLEETRTSFVKVKVSLEKGSVKVVWTLTLSQSVSDPSVLTNAVRTELQKDYPIAESVVAPTLTESDKTTINTVMATIGAVSGLVLTSVVIWAALKTIIKKTGQTIKKVVSNVRGDEGDATNGSGGNILSGLFGNGDVIVSPDQKSSPESPEENKPDTDEYEETTADTQGQYMPQVYVMPSTQLVAPPIHNPGLIQVHGYQQDTYGQTPIVYAVYGT